MTFAQRARLVAWLGTLIRRLPLPVIRVLLLTEVFLSATNPFWAFFAYRRWTGLRVSPREFVGIWLQGFRFTRQHIRHTGEGSGPFEVGFFDPPVRSSGMAERADWGTTGGCGSCRNCCTTNWLPEDERTACVFLGERGCRVYGGVWWDHFQCGRYPAQEWQLAVYRCERFEEPAPKPPRALPMAPREPVREARQGTPGARP